jgi:PAS domain S-box-containing protein
MDVTTRSSAAAQAFLGVPVPLAVVALQPVRVLEANAAFAAATGLRPGDSVEGLDFTLTPLGEDTGVIHLSDRTPRWLYSIVDNSAALVYVKGLDGRYRFVNRHFERRFGLRREDVVGRTDFELFPERSAAAYTEHDREVLSTGAAMEVEEPAETDDRSWLSIKFALTDEHDRPYGLGGISTDITDRKRAEAAAADARDEAQRANRAKSEFLSRMSHELRTPLNSIIGFGQLLSLEPLPDPAQLSVSRILRAGRHLLALINEVLELSRIEAGAQRFAVEPVHAPAPLAEALDLTRPLARERGIELSADMHGGMHKFCPADRQRLTQVLLNLLSNAVKYNRPEGVVRVVFRQRGERLRYLVSDTGPGLDPDEQVQAFLPFERLTAERSDIEGTGLGLALSRSLVEGMGGELGIQHSAKGEGSTFYVELPLCEAPPDRVAEPVGAAGPIAWDLPSMRVLYVEDNLSNLEVVRGVLSRMPAIELIPAMQGGMAVDLAAQHRPDVILLDLNLPDLDGGEVLRRLRADDRTSAIPVVVLSADATPSSIARLKAEGLAGYLTKPLDIAEFIRTLRAAVTASA